MIKLVVKTCVISSRNIQNQHKKTIALFCITAPEVLKATRKYTENPEFIHIYTTKRCIFDQDLQLLRC